MWFPGRWKLTRHRMRTLVRRGKLDEAVAVGKRAIHSRPEDPHVWWFYGDLLLAMGRTEEVLRVMSVGVPRHPETPELAYLLVVALMRVHKEAEARQVAAASARSNPSSPIPRVCSVYIAVDLHSWREARAAADRAMGLLGSQHAYWKAVLGICLFDVPGALERVEALLREAVQELPKHRLTLATLGLVLEAKGDPAAAGYISRAARLHGDAQHFEELLEQGRQKLREKGSASRQGG